MRMAGKVETNGFENKFVMRKTRPAGNQTRDLLTKAGVVLGNVFESRETSGLLGGGNNKHHSEKLLHSYWSQVGII